MQLVTVSIVLLAGLSVSRGEVEEVEDYDVELVAPSPTNWGTWGPYEYCPEGTYVRGMQLKTQRSQGAFGDDTSLNGVTFYCDRLQDEEEEEDNGNVNDTLLATGTPISSHSHRWGDWGQVFTCGEFEVATGFQMRFEPYGGWFVDDTAANNVVLICNGKRGVQGDGTTWGNWYESRICPAKMAMCGLTTQVFTNSGTDDQTAMDGLKARCCNIPNPATVCVPNDLWDLVIECDNIEAVSPTTCTYQKKIGMSNYTSSSEHHWDWVGTYTDIGFDLNGAAGPLWLNFNANLNVSSSTGYDWKTASQDMWFEEVTTTVSFDVPATVKTQLFQIYGSCGIYGARSSRFKRVDTVPDGKGLFRIETTYFDA